MERIELIEQIMALRLELMVIRQDKRLVGVSARSALEKRERELVGELRRAWEKLE